MASIINAATSGGLVTTADTSGILQLQTAGTTAVTVDAAGGVKTLNTIGVGNTNPSTSGAGITFPATQSASTDANTLDDYEEGTWTPTIIGSTTAGTATYLSTTGKYTKVGRVVTVVCYMQWQSHTGTGNMSVAGLPFTNLTDSAGSVGLATNLALTAGKILLLYIGVGATTVRMVETPTGGGAFGDVPIDANVSDFSFSATYFV